MKAARQSTYRVHPDSLTITPATVTINDDDGQPSFAVADASANEGDAITFTVTRSGAMDNAVSVKWNTKAATGAGAASTSDYTVMTTATKLDFAKGVSRQTFTVATTEDTLHEGNETFLVELTEPAGGTIDTAEATGTINDDDAEPTGITLTVSPATVGGGGRRNRNHRYGHRQRHHALRGRQDRNGERRRRHRDIGYGLRHRDELRHHHRCR